MVRTNRKSITLSQISAGATVHLKKATTKFKLKGCRPVGDNFEGCKPIGDKLKVCKPKGDKFGGASHEISSMLSKRRKAQQLETKLKEKHGESFSIVRGGSIFSICHV